MGTAIVLGVDIGTTDSKATATTLDGQEISSVATASRWETHEGRYTDTPADEVVGAALGLLEAAVSRAAATTGPVHTVGIGVTGMGEAGVLLDPKGTPLFPVIAWFDPRGAEEVRRFPTEVVDEFRGRTGLPLGAATTIAKLAWMRSAGAELRGATWLNLAEYVAYRLGGHAASEMSLLARTGLLDQDTETLWPAALDALSAPASLIPTRVLAGTPLGRVSDSHGPVPAILLGAVLTVAGHDHPVAAVGCGVLGPDELFDSFGTAEALVQTVPGALDYAARDRLARNGIDTVHHVLAGRRALVGGTKAGLVLRRTLRLLGADSEQGRRELDDAVMGATPARAAVRGVEVRGAANDDGTLVITAGDDDITPAALWRAALDHVVDEGRACLRRMAREVGPAGATVVGGGWTGMRSVRAAKQASLPGVRFSTRAQAGAYGAALFAAHAVHTAAEMAAEGDGSAVALHRPTGPTPAFAAAFGAAPPRSTTPAPRPQPQEMPRMTQPATTTVTTTTTTTAVTTATTTLADIATDQHTFAIVAMDQRNTLKRMYHAKGIPDPSDKELVTIKADTVEALRGTASAFLLDPTFGMPAVRSLPAAGPSYGVLLAAEPAERGTVNGEPRTHRDPALNAQWVKDSGATALKFFVQLRADRKPAPGEPDTTAEIVQIVGDVVADCREAGIPSVVENLIFPLAGEDAPTPEQRSDQILEAARVLNDLRPDLVKIEYPGSPAACRRLAGFLDVPWAVLSAGVDFDRFADVLRVCCDDGGVSGFIAGRSIWKDAVGLSRPERRSYLAGEGARRLENLLQVIDGRARPYTDL